MNGPPAPWRHHRWWLPLLPAALLLVWHVGHYLPFVADDSLISLRYSRRLLDGHGLTWTAGEPVEGYSNLLWTLGCALLGAVGIDLITAARVLGVGSTLAILVALRALTTGPAAGLASLVFAAAPPVAIWAIGGLEGPLVAALLLWAVVLLRPALEGAHSGPRDVLPAALCLAAACLTRPDPPLFVALLAGMLLLSRWSRADRWRTAFTLAAVPATAVLLQIACRLLYYDDWLPNTAHIKAHTTPRRFQEGLDYVSQGGATLTPLLALAALGIFVAITTRRRRGEVAGLALCAAAWTLYVAVVGGDFFPGYRQLLVVIVLCAALGAVALEPLLNQGRVQAGGVAVLVLGLAVSTLALGVQAPRNRAAAQERWEWDGESVGNTLVRGWGALDPLMAVCAAGTLPYWTGFRALDMLGLNDRHIARQPSVAKERVGHDRGDGAYVLSLQPDFMVFGGAYGGPARFVTGDQLRRMPEFVSEYARVMIEGHDPYLALSDLYVHRFGRLGIKTTRDEIVLPAWFVRGELLRAYDEPGGMAARVGGPGTSTPVELPPGAWRVHIEPPNRWLQVDVMHQSGPKPIIEGTTLHTAKGCTVAVEIDTMGPTTSLRAVVFERVGAAKTRGRKARVLRVQGGRRAGLSAKTLVTALGPVDDTAGWTLDGAAFRDGVRRRGRGRGITTKDIPFLSSRPAGLGDAARGRARSPEFRAEAGSVLRLGVAGGDESWRLAVRLLADGRPVMTWGGGRKNKLKSHLLDLTPWAGLPLQIELLDQAEGRWGYVAVGNIEVHQPAK